LSDEMQRTARRFVAWTTGWERMGKRAAASEGFRPGSGCYLFSTC
jgi:hypothetical protein